ncbi:hypothetical protein EDB80DRAFT_876479 [Ilyonectria destructans]|nr:hypothetical protein EDB80DRAFT_876479 [Ilyonectria destructans]
MAASSDKDPITCHVLDTTNGRPAKGIRVRLVGGAASATAQPKTFESVTNDDGRILVWLPYSSDLSAGEVPVYTLLDVLGEASGASRWTLRFDTAAYFGEDKTFFPEVTVTFRVDEGQTYHVPLLLSPHSYTTYRGS